MEGYKIFPCIIFVLAYVTATVLKNHEEPKIESVPITRLPDTIVPTYYDLSLTIDPENSQYNGHVLLYFDVAETANNVNNIYLHADLDFLQITEILLNDVTVHDMSKIDQVNILIIDGGTEITGQDNVLSITFTGKLSTQDEFGLVKTSYLEKGSEQILIQSNFKPTYARRAFPCLDEPHLKASFSLKITYPEEYKVISNSPVKAESSSNGLKVTEFEKTPKISTYLFSIFFSKLEEANSSPGDGYDVKIFTRPEVANMTSAIAATYSSKIIEQLSIYTGVHNDVDSYQVALPNYYSDALGGFGLFTYSEDELLDEGDKTSARVKQNIIADIAYKISHEWYGGGVSTKWWSDIWANEAVATYLKYIIPDQIDEDLELSNQFKVEVIQKALQHDALPLAQPLSSDINISRDIENKLDSFNYLKGASILHMIKYVVGGTENLKSALQYHWNERQDLGTNGEDMLRDLVKSEDHEEYYPSLQTWAFSPGFPLISAKLRDPPGGRSEVTLLSQKRFVYPVEDAPSYNNDKWDIPLTSTNQGEKRFDKPMNAFYKSNQQAMYIGEGNIWQLINLQGGSFYRVNYEDQLWRRFISYLNSDERAEIEVLSRARLVDDIFNIARTGDVSYDLAFELADYLVDETEYYPWYSALNAFSYILGKLEDDVVEAKLKKNLLDLLDNEVHIPSTTLSRADNLAHIDILKRVMILNWACDLGHIACIEYATNQFKTFKKDQTSLDDYNYRSLIFCNGIRHSENVQEDWNFLWNVFSNSPSVHEKNDILYGLGCAEDKDILISSRHDTYVYQISRQYLKPFLRKCASKESCIPTDGSFFTVTIIPLHYVEVEVTEIFAYDLALTYLQKMVAADSGINKHDAMIVFKAIFSSSVGLDAAVEFLGNNFEVTHLVSFFNAVDVLSEVLYVLAEKLFTDEHLEWIKGVVDNPVLNDYEDVKSRAIVLVSVNNYWKNNYQSNVKNVVIAPVTPPSSTTSRSITTTTAPTTTGNGSTGITTTEPSTTTHSSCEKLFLSKFVSSLVLLVFIMTQLSN